MLVPWVSSRTAATRLAAGGDDLEDDLALLLLPMSAGKERSAERAIARIARSKRRRPANKAGVLEARAASARGRGRGN